MKERDFASTMLAIGFFGLAFALWRSPEADKEKELAARNDHQAQARTVADSDRIGSAMFSWLTDQVGATAAGQSQVPPPAPVDMTVYPVITHGALASLLVPQYIQSLPELDGWNHNFDFRLNTANPLAQHVMGIRSAGRDGAYSGTTYTIGRFAPESFDEDIVWADGFAVRRPAFVLTDREAQKKTAADILNIGTAMFNWFTDQVGRKPVGNAQDTKATATDFSNFPAISYATLESLLVPQYMQSLPQLDGWENPYDFRLNVANPLASDVMAVRSAGRDLSFIGNLYTTVAFDSDFFDQDIAWADGFFVRSPATSQGLSYYALAPCRVFDTRPTSALASGINSLFEIGATCGIPTSARSVTVNVTVVGPTGAGYVTLFPAGLSAPVASTISFAAGQTRSNNAVLALTADGIGSIEARPLVAGNGQVHLVLDVTGYFE
jgi:hypothetical protein